MRTTLKERGFSLVEVMVVASVVAVIGLGSAHMISQQQALATYLEDRLANLQLQNQIQLQLSYTAACTASLNGVSLNLNSSQTSSVTSIRDNLGNVVLSSFSDQGNLRIEQIVLRNRSVPVLGGSGLIDIEVSTTRKRKILDSKAFLPSVVTINASTNPAGAIIRCGGNFGAEIISPGMGFDGLTGNVACATKGKFCTHIESYNFMSGSSGACDSGSQVATCIKACASHYNQNLPGIPNIVSDPGKNNIHSCAARVGVYMTYHHPGALSCNAHFSAYCL